MSTRTATEESRAGMGLMAWLEDTRVRLSLKGVEARFEVRGEFAEVELDQIYHQTTGRALDCTYTFPLPGDAAVHRCEFHVNGRVISARVEEVGEARRLFAEKKAEGRRAGMVEAERDNLFTLSLANVQPGDLVVVRLAYEQTLERLGEQRRLRIPFCPGIRYVPGRPLGRPNAGRGTADDTDQVPDASRLSPPRVEALHPDAAYLDVTGTVGAGEITGLASPSHAVAAAPEGDVTRVTLAGKDALPDQDFLLTWEPLRPATATAHEWRARHGGWHYSLVELRGPADPDAHRRPAGDVYFLVDRSGSMAGIKWTATCRAVTEFVRQMRPQDRAQVTLFESGWQDLLAAPAVPAQLAALRGFQRLESLGTAGGTELLPALEHVIALARRESTEREMTLILITDGQVGNEAAVLAATRGLPRLVIHTVGVDTVVNDGLLQQLAQAHGGQCALLRPDEDIVGAVGRLGHLTARPVLTRLAVPEGWEPAEAPLPGLYSGQTTTVLLRSRQEAEVSLAGLGPDERAITLRPARTGTGGDIVPRLWARRRLNSSGDERAWADRIALAKEFNLVCPGTAFIAWDETERVAVAADGLIQPALEPAGWVGGVGLVGACAPRGVAAGHGARADMMCLYESIAPRHESRFARVMEALGLREPDSPRTATSPLDGLVSSTPLATPVGEDVRGLLARWLAQAGPDGVGVDPAGRLARWLRACERAVPDREPLAWLRHLLELLRPELAALPGLLVEHRQLTARFARHLTPAAAGHR